MKSADILNALSDLPDDMIFEARPTAAVRPRRRILRTALIAAVLAMLLSVTAYAAGGSLAGLRSSLRPGRSWTDLDRLPQAEKLVGVDITLPESYLNGFVFEKMEVHYTERTDDDGAVVETFPSLDARYVRDGSRVKVGVTAERPQAHEGNWQRREVEGITVWYRSFTYLGVPEDYRPSEAEQARVERGELMIGYGADRVETLSTSFARFTLDGALYNLLNMDGLPVQELCAMAEEIIEGIKRADTRE